MKVHQLFDYNKFSIINKVNTLSISIIMFILGNDFVIVINEINQYSVANVDQQETLNLDFELITFYQEPYQQSRGK